MDLTNLLSKLHSLKGRIIAGLGMFGALINGLAPDSARPLDLGKAATVFIAAVVWLYAELGASNVPSAADVALYQRIKSVIDSTALSFLRDHDFGASIRDLQTQPVSEICSWHGADAEFQDKEIQKSWSLCRERFETLNRNYAEILGPTHNPNRLAAIPPGTHDWDIPQHLQDNVARLNNNGSDAYRNFIDFDRLARKRLNL